MKNIERQIPLLAAIFLFAFTITFRIVDKPKEKYVPIVAEALPKTVTVGITLSRINPDTDEKETQDGICSGVLITSEGHILTAAHCTTTKYTLEGIEVRLIDSSTHTATVVYSEPKRDLSLLKIDVHDAPYAILARPDSLQVGQEVIAIGAPFGFSGTVTTGVISALDRDDFHYDMVQMSAAVNPGNSGGPLFNLNGELIGINSLFVASNPYLPTWSGLGFAVSAGEINRFLVTFRRLSGAYRASGNKTRHEN